MRKQGPCYHCGTNSTPLWRNGPPEKPVLCNACGSRYRIRGNLANYAPKHAQGQPIAKRSRTTTRNKPNFELRDKRLSSNISYSTASDDSLSSYKSSSGSALSYPQSCYHLKDEEDGLQTQDEIKESDWKTGIPSRKRSLVVYRNLTTIEKLQKELLNILKYEEPSMVSEKEEDLLIYNANSLQVSCNEIGLGTILLKPTTSFTSHSVSPSPSF